MRRWLVFVGGVVILLLLAFAFLYWAFGLKYYVLRVNLINNLDTQSKKQASDYFFGADNYIYRGTLAHVDTTGYGGIWVWGRTGLRYFQSDQFTVFSFYRTCSQVIKTGIKNGTGVTLDDREIYPDIRTWSSNVKQGYYVEARTAAAGLGGVPGNLREVYAYDSDWPFMPIIIDMICGK